MTLSIHWCSFRPWLAMYDGALSRLQDLADDVFDAYCGEGAPPGDLTPLLFLESLAREAFALPEIALRPETALRPESVPRSVALEVVGVLFGLLQPLLLALEAEAPRAGTPEPHADMDAWALLTYEILRVAAVVENEELAREMLAWVDLRYRKGVPFLKAPQEVLFTRVAAVRKVCASAL